MARGLATIVAVLAMAASASAALHDASFYAPPAHLVAGPPGTVVWTRPATGLAALPAAARTDVVIFRSRSVSGRPIVQSGTLAIPEGDPPPGGWPVVSFFHVTTGAADSCAPSRVTADNPELERLTRGDSLATRLLRSGVAVARPDGEGIGTPGGHPYLIGRSLARSQADLVRAARDLDVGIGRRWVAAGHSEGAVASLFSAAFGPRLARRLDLRGVAAFAPVTRVRDQLDLIRHYPVPGPPGDGLSALGSLIVTGAAEIDPVLDSGLTAGALSPAAAALLPHVEQRCLVELTRPDSWGGLAPAEIAGPRFEEFKPRFYDILDRNDVRHVKLGTVPVRIDHGALDAVAPLALTALMVEEQRARGADITLTPWPTATHVDITKDTQAGPEAVRWILARLG